MHEQGISQADPQGQPAGESDRTDVSELEGLLPLDDDESPRAKAGDAAPEGEQEQEQQQEPDQIVDATQIALDDGRKVSVRELKETFSTFQRKAQEMAEQQRNTVTHARAAVAAFAEQKAQELHLLSQRIETLVAPGIDEAALMQLASTDPQQYYHIAARLNVAREMRANVEREAQQLWQQAQQQRQQAQHDTQMAHKQLLEVESARLAGQKWWNTDFQVKALSLAKRHGIPESVVRDIPYAGFFEIARKAMAYDDAISKTKGGKELPTHTAMTPGASPARGLLNKQKAVAQSYERASHTKNRADIGRWLDQVLE